MSLLTLGMTADAAAAHRHEFSPTQTPTSPSFFNAIPFIRASAPDYFKSTPRRPTIVLEEPEDVEEIQQGLRGLVAATTTKDALVEEQPEEEPTVEILTPAKQRAPRLKTIYQLGYPPPSQANHRHHLSLLKAKSAPLVQFQRLSNVPRPVPVYDLVSASTASSILGRHSLKQYTPPVDLVLMDSEQYDDDDDDNESGGSSEKEKAAKRNVVAGLSFKEAKKDTPSIGMVQLRYGLTWDVKKLNSSGYEFTFVDENDHGIKRTARWVKRASRSRRATHTEGTIAAGDAVTRPPREDRFIFSVLSSESRKHPILASMTRQRLEIHDQFTASTELSRPSSPTRNDSFQSSNSADSVPSLNSFNDSQQIVGIPADQLRLFIYATAAWVAMQESFDQTFRGEVRSEASSNRCCSPISLSRPSSPAILTRGITHLGHGSRTGTPQTPTTPTTAQRSNSTASPGASRIIPRRWTGDFHQRSASIGLEQSLSIASIVLPAKEDAIDPPLMSAPIQPTYTPTVQLQQQQQQQQQPPLSRHSISFADSTPQVIAPPFRPVRNSLMGPPPRAADLERDIILDRGMMERGLDGTVGEERGLKRKKSSVKRLVGWCRRKIGTAKS